MPQVDNLPPRPSLRLRIGVVGHRPRPGRPFDEPAVRASLERAFHLIEQHVASCAGPPYDDRPPCVTLISALAEGADQIGAEVFLAGRAEFAGERRLEAVLPFAVADYARTFLTAGADPETAAREQAAVKAMRDWVARADAVLTLADWSLPADDALSPLASHRRDSRFATAGRLIVRQSDVLIVIWDGMPARGTGGTTEFVASALGQGVPVIWIDAADGGVWLVVATQPYGDLFALIRTSRMKLDAERIAAALDPLLKPDDEAGTGRALDDYLHREQVPHGEGVLSLYDWLLVRPAKRRTRRDRPPAGAYGKVKIDHVRGEIEDPQWRGYAGGELGYVAHLARFARSWADADAISTRLGHVYRSNYVAIFLFTPLAVLAGLTGLMLHEWKGWLVALEVALLLIAIAIFMYSAARCHHQRWLGTRALAEQFRARWALALLGGSGRRAPAAHAEWNAWLFNAYAADLPLPSVELDRGALAAIARAVQEGIVASQVTYHHNNNQVLRAIHKRLERASWVAFVCAVASAALCLMVWPWGCEGHACMPAPPFMTFRGWPLDAMAASSNGLVQTLSHAIAQSRGSLVALFTILCGVLPALGASMAGLRYHGDFERFSERSEKTRHGLEEVKRALDDLIQHLETPDTSQPELPHFETLLSIFQELERVLLSDLDDWRFVYRARPSPDPI